MARRGVAGKTTPPRRGGRPSRDEATRLGERILDVASALFLAAGYGATSIEKVAQRAGISKRTFYHRFPDKAVLFSAVVHRVVDRLRPPAGTPLYDEGTPEDILRRLARLTLRAALTPTALALTRLMVAEAQRFPELAAIAAREGSLAAAVGRIAALLARDFALDRPEFAAAQFFQLVIALPQRRALGLGAPMTEVELDRWADDCVNLFLNGCRNWKTEGR